MNKKVLLINGLGLGTSSMFCNYSEICLLDIDVSIILLEMEAGFSLGKNI